MYVSWERLFTICKNRSYCTNTCGMLVFCFLVNLTYFGFLDLPELTDKDYFSKPTFVRFLIQNRSLLGHGLPIPNVVDALHEIHSLAMAHGDVQDAMDSQHDSAESDRRVTRRGSIRAVR